MNLINGRYIDKAESLNALDTLGASIAQTMVGKLPLDDVLYACDTLSEKLNAQDYLPLLMALGLEEESALQQLEEAKRMLSKPYLQEKLKRELGEDFGAPNRFVPLDAQDAVSEQMLPLGVLLHIAAGNAEGLPAFSVIEGLLTGNINILKLPGLDDGISTRILYELIQIQPLLAEYIYVFDTPSEDIASITKMADVADAVVVWGGDAAVTAVRTLAKPNTKIIEWGHKLSFAYVTEAGLKDEQLAALARHICTTNQLLCNSCQGIYLDTEDMNRVQAFCKIFLPILERESKQIPSPITTSLQAQLTLQLRSESLLSIGSERSLYKGDGVSLLAEPDSSLSASMLFRNGWVRRLPKKEILRTLRPYKNTLNTVGLLCAEEERLPLAETFFKAGAVRVTKAGGMSNGYCGSPHDGEYALGRYVKIVSVE